MYTRRLASVKPKGAREKKVWWKRVIYAWRFCVKESMLTSINKRMFSTLYRWWCADGIGAVGKCEQVASGIHRGGAGGAPCKLPERLLARVATVALSHAGSIAQIFTAQYHEKHIALKVVPSEVARLVLDEVSAANNAGGLLATLTRTRMAEAVQKLNEGLARELCMQHERAMARRLREALRANRHRVRVPEEVTELCDRSIYAYEYVVGMTARDAIAGAHAQSELVERICSTFFELLHLHGLLLLDPNLNNFIVDHEGCVWLIDTGATEILSEQQLATARALHSSRGDAKALSQLLSVPEERCGPIVRCMEAFWDSSVSLPNDGEVLGMMTDPRMLTVDFDPDIIALFRATATLVTSLQRAGVTSIDVVEQMDAIRHATSDRLAQKRKIGQGYDSDLEGDARSAVPRAECSCTREGENDDQAVEYRELESACQ